MNDEDDDAVALSLTDLLTQTAVASHILPPNLSAAPASSYLDRLVALPLSVLVKEPSIISQEASTVEAELTNLCYREYSTFLSVHQCSTAIKSAFDDFQNSLDRLLDSVPILEDECKIFVDKTHSLSRNRNRAILVQETQDKLLDLLEIPRLMETCVRNGYYHEAMELAAHAASLPLDSNLVQDMLKEVEGVAQLMLSQLLSLLREPVKLPTVMKTIGYLRRLGLEDAPLGLAFLAGRLDNFRNHLLQIEMDRTEPSRYVRKYIDLFREHVYDILSQYSAVFDDHDVVVSFANQCVSDLVELVAAYIPRIADPASLSSILIQLGYCSLSFARIGLDFGPLVAAPFADTMLAGYAHAVGAASSTLGSTIKEAALGQGVPVDSLMDASQKSTIQEGPSISVFPPLALFVNQNLAALNTLRLLAPSSFSKSLLATLDRSLLDVTEAIQAIIREPTPRTHSRTPSTPRAQLLRQNTETQLSPGVRASKRKQQQQMAYVLGQTWISVVQLLGESLSTGIFAEAYTKGDSLSAAVQSLQATLDVMRAAELNGSKSDKIDDPKLEGKPSAVTDVINASRNTASAEVTESPVKTPDIPRPLSVNAGNETVIAEEGEVETTDSSQSLPTAVLSVQQVDSTVADNHASTGADAEMAEVLLDVPAVLSGTSAEAERDSTRIKAPSAVIEPMFSAPIDGPVLPTTSDPTPLVFPKEADMDIDVSEQLEQRVGRSGEFDGPSLSKDGGPSGVSPQPLTLDKNVVSLSNTSTGILSDDPRMDPASNSDAETPIAATPTNPSPAASDSGQPEVFPGTHGASNNKKKKKKKKK